MLWRSLCPGSLRQLREYLRGARCGVLGRLSGLSEYDLRRPMTPTGTNLLGVVKHLGGMGTATLLRLSDTRSMS
jgi:hypothetical protein